MEAIFRSLREQVRNGTLERNTIIARRALAGENISKLASEYKISKALVYKVIHRHVRNVNEAQNRIGNTGTNLAITE
jgi:Mor family transcriptional regulator